MNAIFRAERDTSAKRETRGLVARVLNRAKYRLRPSWLIKPLSCRLGLGGTFPVGKDLSADSTV